jgi:hypothetical protein
VRWNIKWSDIEGTPDHNTWQYLDDAVALAATNNKTCGIFIDAGTHCPAWLYAAPYNAQSYALVDTPVVEPILVGSKIPVPGDTVFMTRWQKFITDFGARYNNNAAVSYIIIGGISNNDTWDIATGPQDTAALGSTIEKVNAWKSSAKQIIDFYMSAFPSTTVMGYPVPPFNPLNAAEDPATSMREVSDYAANTYNCHFGYSVAPLQSCTTRWNYFPANELFLHWTTNPTHGETLNPASSPDDFDATLHVALDLKIRGMEIDKVDFENAALQNFIVGSGPYAGEAGGITPRRIDMLAIPAPTPCPTATVTPTPTPTSTPMVQVTVQTTPVGLMFSVDGIAYNSTQTFSWASGSSHTIATTSPQGGGTGVQQVWANWSDCQPISHAITPITNMTYIATFTTQYYLTMSHGTGGTVSPGSGWKSSGATVSISATPTSNTSVSYSFSGWTGNGSGSYSGANTPASITINGPITENATFVQNPVQVTVQSNPTGHSFSVDGTTYTATQAFSWNPGSSHTIATTSPQNGSPDVRYVWSNWSDGGPISHTVAPTTNKTYTAKFATQYYLTMSHGTGGTLNPVSGWKNSGATVSVSATPTNNSSVSYNFSGWTGTGTGSYTGTNNPTSIAMNGPITENASFTQNNVQVTVQTNPLGRTFSVDGTAYSSTQMFSWVPGSSHTIATTSPQSGATSVRYVWSKWSDGGAISHTVAPTTNKTYTATFTTQYYLTMNHGTGGTVAPPSGWKNSGVVVSISATPASGYSFRSWTGSGTGSYTGSTNPSSITIGGPITEAAAFTQ